MTIEPVDAMWVDWLVANSEWLLVAAAILAAAAGLIRMADRMSPRVASAIDRAAGWVGAKRMRRRTVDELVGLAEALKESVGENGKESLHDHVRLLREDVQSLRGEIPTHVQAGLREHEQEMHGRDGEEGEPPTG